MCYAPMLARPFNSLSCCLLENHHFLHSDNISISFFINYEPIFSWKRHLYCIAVTPTLVFPRLLRYVAVSTVCRCWNNDPGDILCCVTIFATRGYSRTPRWLGDRSLLSHLSCRRNGMFYVVTNELAMSRVILNPLVSKYLVLLLYNHLRSLITCYMLTRNICVSVVFTLLQEICIGSK